MTKSLLEVVEKALEGKYFQKNSDATKVIEIKGISKGIDYGETKQDAYLDAWGALENERTFPISFDDMQDYKLISKEKFQKIKSKYEMNKANLSAPPTKIIEISNYKTKKDKERLKKFYSLSDHIEQK